jgi:putative oxidoreductase
VQSLVAQYERLVLLLSGRLTEGVALLLCRLSLAGVFWRAGRSKIEEGTLLTIKESTRFLFEYEYSGIPLPSTVALYLATYAEHALSLLLAVGFATRLSALGLLGMTMTIQLFVYPDAWWAVHSLWAALCLIILSAGGGCLSADQWFRSRSGLESHPR